MKNCLFKLRTRSQQGQGAVIGQRPDSWGSTGTQEQKSWHVFKVLCENCGAEGKQKQTEPTTQSEDSNVPVGQVESLLPG